MQALFTHHPCHASHHFQHPLSRLTLLGEKYYERVSCVNQKCLSLSPVLGKTLPKHKPVRRGKTQNPAQTVWNFKSSNWGWSISTGPGRNHEKFGRGSVIPEAVFFRSTGSLSLSRELWSENSVKIKNQQGLLGKGEKRFILWSTNSPRRSSWDFCSK